MNPSHLLFSCLLAATTAWADSTNPLAFFAKINGSLLPIFETIHEHDGHTSILLTHANTYPEPVALYLQDDLVFKHDYLGPESVGFANGLLSIAGDTPNSRFYFDQKMKFSNTPLQSCEIFHGDVRGIFNGDSTIPKTNCVDVDLYLSPYDKETKSPKTYVTFPAETSAGPNDANPGNVQKRSDFSSKPKLPLVFFAYFDDVYHPLFGWNYENQKSNLSMFAYGDSSAVPAEFTFKDNTLYTNHKLHSGYAGFEDSTFVFGPTVPRTELQFSNRRRVLNGPFYSCQTFDDVVYTIAYKSYNLPSQYCIEVDIFLLPYDKETKSAVIDMSDPQE